MADKVDYRQLNKKRGFYGQSLLEMALMLPFLLVLIIGAIEFGRLFYTKIVITNAAREGAYYLATHPSDYDEVSGTAPNAVLAAEQEAINSGISEIVLSFSQNKDCDPGEYSITVTAETSVENLLVLGFFEDVFTLSTDTYDGFVLGSSVEMMIQ